MIIDDIVSRLEEMCTHILFDYNQKSCGIDPLSRNRYDVWYGDKDFTGTSIEEVINKPFFDGKSLKEIANEIENLDL